MAETYANYLQMTSLQLALRRLLEMQGRLPAVIGGNQFLYYNPRNRRDNLSPDVYVALDVESGGRDVWFTWIEGKAPDIVFEITSPSTQRQDLSTAPRGKRTLYAQLGVREYYVYDPQLALRPPLQAFKLREGRLEEVELLPSGGVWSELLAAELRSVAVAETEWEPAGTYLRVIDPTTGAPIRVGEEVQQDYRAAQERVTALQGRLAHVEQTVQEQLAQADRTLQALQERFARAEQTFQERLAHTEQTFQERLAHAEQERLAAQERLARAEQTFQERLTHAELAFQEQLARAAQERLAADERARRAEEALARLGAAHDESGG